MALVILASACTEKEEEKSAEDQLKAENAMLRQEVETWQKNQTDLNTAIEEVEAELQNITSNEQRVDSLRNATSGHNRRQKIRELMATLNTSIEASRTRIESLEAKLGSSQAATSGLRKMISRLRKELDERQRAMENMSQTINSLKSQVNELDQNLANTNSALTRTQAQLSAKNQEYTQAEEQLSTAFYIVGNRRALLAAQVLVKQSGLSGLVSAPKLSGSYDESRFTKINIRAVGEIEIGNASKVTVVSSHPNGAYAITERYGIKYLTISDYKRFWAGSKYLVIEAD